MIKKSSNDTADPGPQKVLVTGSRGKSSIVRLLHAAFQRAGLQSHARITGVIPRELGPQGERLIERSAGAHVEEMRWWLKRLPPTAGVVVLENSAISPDLQPLAAQWLQPDITILSNTFPDHQESWGDSSQSAANALVEGIPVHGRVIIPAPFADDHYLLGLLNRRRCQVVYSEPAKGFEKHYQAVNAGLALTAAGELGLDEEASLDSMLKLPPDISDFRVVKQKEAKIAMAFSANDILSTQQLFRDLGWPENETRLIYNHRRDRPERLKSFLSWLRTPDWQQVLMIGDRPLGRTGRAEYARFRSTQQFLNQLKPGERVFGCGNTKGLPVALMTNASFMHA